jgi:hypothetical protein
MLAASLAAAAVLATGTLPAGLEPSAGLSVLATQHVFSYALEPAVEVGAGWRVREAWVVGAGVRLGLGPVLPEGYLHLSAAPALERWLPRVGLELGLSARTRFTEGDQILRETRQAAEESAGVTYVAVRAEPLAFRWSRWRISVLELQLGTFFPDPGRTLRVQLGLVTVGVAP